MADTLSWLRQPIAHRALHSSADGIIENSISALRAAIRKGFAVEIDIQPAQDGTPVVFHDDNLQRLTGETGQLMSLYPQELKTLSLSGSTDTIPLLSDFLVETDKKVPVIIEVKCPENLPANLQRIYAEKIAKAVNLYSGRTALMSFDSGLMQDLSELTKNKPLGLVIDNPTNLRQSLNLFKSWDFLAYNIDTLPAVAPLMARNWHNKLLLTWTIRTKCQQRIATRWADAMIFEALTP